MLLTETQLRKVIAYEAVGDVWPYRGGTEDDIEAHLHETADAIGKLRLIDLSSDFDHYGSGYASYVHIFCEKAGGRSRTIQKATLFRKAYTHIDGLAVYLSRLAPFAAYGRERRVWSKDVRGGGQIYADSVYTTPDDDWSVEIGAIRAVLEEKGLALPTYNQWVEKLPFMAEINTNFDDTHVFDAIFYWRD